MRRLVSLLALAHHGAAARFGFAARQTATRPPLVLQLPTFTAVELGTTTGCWPLALHIAPGVPALEIDAGEDESAAAAVAATVSEQGVLSLHVAEPGFSTGNGPLRVTLRVPDGTLTSLATGPSARDVLVSATPAAAMELAPGGLQGRVVLRPHGPSTLDVAGSLVLTVTQGSQAVTVCSPASQVVSFVEVTNNAVANVRVENYTAAKATLRSTGKGDLYVFPGAAFGSAEVQHSGQGTVQVAALSTYVLQTGAGSLYIADAKSIAGRVSGTGNIYHSSGDSTVIATGKGQVVLVDNLFPAPLITCDAALPVASAGAAGAASWHAFTGDIVVSASVCDARPAAPAPARPLTLFQRLVQLVLRAELY